MATAEDIEVGEQAKISQSAHQAANQSANAEWEAGNAFASKLRNETSAVKLTRTSFGLRRALTDEQKSAAASVFGAEVELLGMTKKLLDQRHPAYKAVTRIRTQAVQTWRDYTVPYPESGIRLIRKDRIGAFEEIMGELRQRLQAAANDLQAVYEELREQARVSLGDLFDPGDYPDNIAKEFDFEVAYPSVEPPEYLKQLHPHLYQQESERVAARFQEAARLAEEAFAAELANLVAHLAERLKPDPTGKQKKLHRSALENLSEFFERVQSLHITSGGELDEICQTARQVIQGVDVDALKESVLLRQEIGDKLTGVAKQLDGLIAEKPKRLIKLLAEDEPPVVDDDVMEAMAAAVGPVDEPAGEPASVEEPAPVAAEPVVDEPVAAEPAPTSDPEATPEPVAEPQAWEPAPSQSYNQDPFADW